jgi:hypothetical protein
MFLRPPMGMNFCEHVPNSLRNKNPKKLIPNLLKEKFFWPPKHYSPPQPSGKKSFSSTLNVTISQMKRNECLRFCAHVEI